MVIRPIIAGTYDGTLVIEASNKKEMEVITNVLSLVDLAQREQGQVSFVVVARRSGVSVETLVFHPVEAKNAT